MTNKPAKPKRARHGHPFGSVKRPSPRYTADYQTPFGGAAKALQIDSDKRLRVMLGNRVSIHTIRDWRRGKAKAPEWAMVALAEECDRLRGMVDRAMFWFGEYAKEKASDSAGLKEWIQKSF